MVTRLRKANVPAGPINSLDDVFADPTVRHLGLIAEVDHPTAGRVRAPGIPVRMDGTPPSVRLHPPLLGEQTKLRVRLDQSQKFYRAVGIVRHRLEWVGMGLEFTQLHPGALQLIDGLLCLV